MKILIFGIDGLGRATLEKLGLNKLAKRMDLGVVGNPKIHNVISRGWPEIYTGKTAFETGGFYQSPTLKNGKICPTQKTGLSFIKNIVDNEGLLWNKLNKHGHRVGLFTIPTVTTPEKIHGFCVSATGAGKFTQGCSEDDFYPKNILKGLQVSDIDLGFRMGYGAYIPDSIQNLEKMGNKHIADYFYLLNRLLDKNPVDVCFAASRFINEMAYKFFLLCADSPKNIFEENLREVVLSLCLSFDSQLDDFINKIDPEHLFIVSDHGIGDYNYELNLNQFLCEAGYIKRRSIFYGWKEVVRPLYYWSQRNLFRRKIGSMAPKYDFNNSKLFSIGFTNVLYLNDNRFYGGVYSKIERKEYLTNAVKRLNAKAEANNLDEFIKFELNQANHGEVEGVLLPDIICVTGDGISNSERKKVVLHRCDFQFNSMFEKGFYGEYSGCKTEDTIASYVGPNDSKVNFENLPKVYDSILKISESYLSSGNKLEGI